METLSEILKHHLVPILSAFVSGTICWFITFIKCKMGMKTCENENLKNGLLGLLRCNIVKSYNHARDTDSCSLAELEAVLLTYENYKKLGGNGIIDYMIEEIREISLRS